MGIEFSSLVLFPLGVAVGYFGRILQLRRRTSKVNPAGTKGRDGSLHQ